MTGSFSGSDDTSANSAYECCAAAFADPNFAQVWYYANGGGDYSCSIIVGDQCAAQSDSTWKIENDTGNPPTGVIGNAECGRYTS